MNGSFLELDGSTDMALKTKEDVLKICKHLNLPTPTHIIETSPGHFHLIWTYERPLLWTPKNERWWTAQQRRLIEAFHDFGPDEKACLNPVQFLRNPTQLNPYNYKRNCVVEIHTTLFKTSLSAIQKALDEAGFENPRIPAAQIIRQDMRRNKFIIETYKEWGDRLGLSEGTMKREVPKLLANGDMRQIASYGNNKGITRRNLYESIIYVEPYTGPAKADYNTKNIKFSKVSSERSKTNLLANARLVREFSEQGIEIGLRNKAIFACGLFEKWRNGGEIGFDKLYERLYTGFLRCGISEKEYIRTLRNVLKKKYVRPLSIKKLRQWGLIKSLELREPLT